MEMGKSKGRVNSMIQIFDTYIHPEASEMVSQTLQSTFISEGKKVKEFEDQLNRRLGMINPIAVNSGSTALELALDLAGIKAGDEVICPAQTFIATGIAILRYGAVPVFADIQYETGNIDPSSIRSKITERTKAIMPVHWGGYPCDMDEILDIAKEYGLKIIEDAAHATGAIYKEKSIGAISEFTCFSFQAIKHVTTGDGGAVCCRRDDDFRQGLNKRWFGVDRANALPSILGERIYNLAEIGFKYHMNDYAATLGLANLLDIETRLAKRRKINAIYREKLKNVAGISLFSQDNQRESSCWLFGLHVENRENFVKGLNDKGIVASVVHQRIDKNDCFGGINGDLYNQARFDATQIHIPLHDKLSDYDVEKVVSTIKSGW